MFGLRSEAIANRWNGCKGLAESNRTDWKNDAELALVWRPVRTLKTYVKGTRFHRSAFCDELSYTQDGRFLRPETGWSLNAGADWQLTEEAWFSVDAYAMRMEDEIFYNPHAKDFGGYWGGYNANSPSATRRIGLDSALVWKREKTAEAKGCYAAAGDKCPLLAVLVAADMLASKLLEK